MGLREDLERFRTVGEQRRQDLKEFITYGDLEPSGRDRIAVPIKIVSLPEFEYDRRDVGGVGQASDGVPDVGQPISMPTDQEGDEPGEAGDTSAGHEYYEMDPEEFAEALDETLGLDLEPKGTRVDTEIEGPYTELRRSGPDSVLDVDRMFKEGLKRKLAMEFDEAFLEKICRVESITPREAFAYARERSMPVSLSWIETTIEEVPAEERGRWPSIDAVEAEHSPKPVSRRIREEGLRHIPFRREDERYRYPEHDDDPESNVVVVNIRDVSGSMREEKRDLVERTFTTLDWYLTGKYDTAEFIYIAHDAEAWEVDRADFFGIRSGGGTKISSAYELAVERLEAYPWSEWNRYVFAAGDSENSSNDTEQRVIPMIESIDANLHAYVETQPSGNAINATHAEELERYFGTDDESVVVTYVNERADVIDAITDVLRAGGENYE